MSKIRYVACNRKATLNIFLIYLSKLKGDTCRCNSTSLHSKGISDVYKFCGLLYVLILVNDFITVC